MTCIPNTKSKRQLAIAFAAAFAVSGLLVLGNFVPMASAQARHGDDRRGGDFRGGGGGWGGAYIAPPVIYGSPYYAPYYAPPPVVYGPTLGIYTPGLSIGIR